MTHAEASRQLLTGERPDLAEVHNDVNINNLI
jgi:hypothetical protein